MVIDRSKPQKSMGSLKRLFKESEAADCLGVVQKTLQAWRAQGKGPRYVRLNGGRAIRYPEDALIEYQESLREYQSTSEYAG